MQNILPIFAHKSRNVMDVFFFEAFEEEAESLKHYLKDQAQAGYSWKSIQEYGAEDPPAPIISVRTQSAIPQAWAPKLKAIISRSTGYDHLRDYLAQTGGELPCGYLPLYCHRSVAEQGLLMMMSLARRVFKQVDHFNTFLRDNLTGSELEGKTLLVAGVGNIGYEMVKIGKGLNMKLLGVDLYENKEDVTYVTIEEGLAQADYCVCAMDLTDDNRGYFDESLLRKAKKGMIFVNVSRGELSPSSTLLKLLEEGQLGGVGLDVYNEEKILAKALRENGPKDHPEVQAVLTLMKHPKAICTPHNAFNTEESVARKSEQSIQQLLHFMQKGEFIWQAN
jgi:D-lactate dehydrogenase